MLAGRCFTKSVACCHRSVRWRSARAGVAEQARRLPDDTIDPEWVTAKPYESIPGISRWQLVTRFAKGGRYDGLDLTDLHRAMREEFGPLVRIPGVLRRLDAVMSFNPEDFAKVFRTEGPWPMRRSFQTMSHYREVVRPEIFGEMGGLVTSQGETWQKMRSLSNPVLMQPKTVNVYVSTMDETARELIAIISSLRDEKHELPQDFIQWVYRWALEVTCVMALDTRLGALSKNVSTEGQTLLDSVEQVFELTYELDILPSIWRYYKTPTFKKLMRAYDTMVEIIMSKIEAALARIEQNPTSIDNQSVLYKLLKIDKHVAVVTALDMMFAGIDTTSTSTLGTLYCLATNPDKQAKLRDELRTILPKKDSTLTVDSMRNLPYLRACIKEGLRMVPPIAGNLRATGRNIVLQGYRIPKGTDIAMSSQVLMHDDSVFSRAKEYIPERWLGGQPEEIPNAKETHPFVFLPFGFGSRSCVGKRLAMMEMEVLLSRLIRQFEFRWNYGEFKLRTTIINLPGSPLPFEMKDVVD
uniref:Uncharacterized protein n=1 Tax=Anopheles farauti TaxID=69004 RepID=A0A182Q137_9DIPT